MVNENTRQSLWAYVIFDIQEWGFRKKENSWRQILIASVSEDNAQQRKASQGHDWPVQNIHCISFKDQGQGQGKIVLPKYAQQKEDPRKWGF